MQDFSLATAATPLVVVETDSSGAKASVVVAWLAERSSDGETIVSPVVVSYEGDGSLLRVVRDRGAGHAAIVPCKDNQGLPAGDVEAIARELRDRQGVPQRMVSRSRV